MQQQLRSSKIMEQQNLRSLLLIRSCVLAVVLLAAAAGGRDSRAEAAVLEYDWEAGTYFYHGHLAMQRATGLFGSLIVSLPPGKTEPVSYDGGDLSVLLSDWYHKYIYQQEQGFSSPDCLQRNATNPACAPFVLPVQPRKTYRLCIGSMATLSSVNFKIENHILTVVAADGRYIEPFVVDNLDVYSEQSYSVLLTANQDPTQNYWVGVSVRGRKPATPTGLAILQYLPNSECLLPPTPAPMGPVWNDFAESVAQAQKYSAKKGLESAPRTTSHKLLILMTQNIINGYTRWAVNNISQVPSATPLLAAFKFKLWNAFNQTPPPQRPPQYTNNKHFDSFATPNPNTTHASLGNGVYVSKLGEVVDIVLQNTNTLVPNNSEIHPWHFHGHNFWVLGYGEGVFDPRSSTKTYNLVNPPLRNTVAVFPHGWVAIRFIADNPGVWPFHCHVEPHLFVGMGTVFAEGIHKLPHIPSQTLGCGLTKPTSW
ncbi:unnamed protein product [Sphagnum tenellum]